MYLSLTRYLIDRKISWLNDISDYLHFSTLRVKLSKNTKLW